MTGIKLTLFKCGYMSYPNRAFSPPTGTDSDGSIPVPWYFIEHPKGNIVIDGGNAKECLTDLRGHWGKIADIMVPLMNEDDFCVNALKKAGHDPDSVKYVVQSHLHHDHTGAIGNFRNAKHIVRQAEWSYANAPDWYMVPAYCRKDWDKPGLEWEFLDDSPVIDFFHDGSLQMISTPGHCPGHQSFLVNLEQAGPMLLGCDAVMFKSNWERETLVPFTSSMSDAVRSIERLRGIVERTGATLVLGHDHAELQKFEFATKSYQ